MPRPVVWYVPISILNNIVSLYDASAFLEFRARSSMRMKRYPGSLILKKWVIVRKCEYIFFGTAVFQVNEIAKPMGDGIAFRFSGLVGFRVVWPKKERGSYSTFCYSLHSFLLFSCTPLLKLNFGKDYLKNRWLEYQKIVKITGNYLHISAALHSYSYF